MRQRMIRGVLAVTAVAASIAAVLAAPASAAPSPGRTSALVSSLEASTERAGLPVGAAVRAGQVQQARHPNGPPPPTLRMDLRPSSGNVGPGRTATAEVSFPPANLTGPVQLRTSDVPDGVTVSFSADSVPVGASATLTITVAANTPPGEHQFRVIGIHQIKTAYQAYTLTVPPATCSTATIMTNGGFEDGNQGWNASPGVIDNSTRQPADSGVWKAWFGGYGRSQIDDLAQMVTLPGNCRKYELTFFLHVDTAERGRAVRDQFSVVIDGTEVATFSNLDANKGYRGRVLDMSSYVGRTVTIAFVGVEDDRRQTSFVMDDVTLVGFPS